MSKLTILQEQQVWMAKEEICSWDLLDHQTEKVYHTNNNTLLNSLYENEN